MILPDWLPELLRSPGGAALGGWADGVPLLPDGTPVPVTASGVLRFPAGELPEASTIQQEHYDRVAERYAENLDYPHTRTYQAYLDAQVVDAARRADLSTVVELCAGRGEAFDLLGERVGRGAAVDISLSMLEAGRARQPVDRIVFLQADATAVPLASGAFDTVVLLGGIHHVPDRAALFAEVARLLRPGGTLIFREPVDDFLPWRLLRKVVYRLSPALDADTESPLRRATTERQLTVAGLALRSWETRGFLGFCLLMNSDVLVLNRLLRHVPGIERITRWWIALDDRCTRHGRWRARGLQVVGVATIGGDGGGTGP